MTKDDEVARLTAENADLKRQNALLQEKFANAERQAARLRDAVNLAFERVSSVKQLHQNAAAEAAINALKATERIQQALGDAHQALSGAKD